MKVIYLRDVVEQVGNEAISLLKVQCLAELLRNLRVLRTSSRGRRGTGTLRTLLGTAVRRPGGTVRTVLVTHSNGSAVEPLRLNTQGAVPQLTEQDKRYH